MKNFKKLFASIATLALLATAVPTTVLGAASYSDELQGAYDYAYSIGITTQGTIDTANMYGSLIRSHMAKMMVNYAKEVMGMTPDTSIVCEFTDVANQSEELQGYITEACQLGIMGVGISAFNPNGVVTRAQFGTVLSRVLYGDTYNDGDPYYVNHLNALKDAGIMNNIDNPNMNEVRGYVMLMMQRAAGAETPAICETPENVLSCSLGLDTCPAECQAVEAKEGTLTLSSVGVDYTSIPKAGLVSFGSVKLVSDGSDITVNSIKIKKQGLSTLDSATRVWFEKDGVRVSSKASFSDNVATVSFTTPLVVKSNETVDVILSLNQASAGDEIQLVSTDVNSSAQTVNGSFTSPSLRTAAYTVMTVTGAAVVNSISQKVDSSKLVEIGQINLTKTASDKAALVKALTLNNSGSSELSYLEDIGLYRDDVKVSTKTTVGTRTITFTLDDEIKNTQTSAINYVVKAKIANADRVGDTYNFYLRNLEDLTVVEKDTAFRATIAGTVPSVMGLITIAGGDVRFNETTVSSQTLVPGTKNVVFYDGTIQSLQGVTLDTVTLHATCTTGFDKVLQNLYVKIGSTVIAVDSIPTGTGNQTFLFDGQATVNGTVAFQVYGDLKTDAPVATINGRDAVDSSRFSTKEYVDNGQSVTSFIGSIAGRNLNITAADFARSNSSASSKNVQRGDRNVELAKLEFSTTSDVVSKLYSFKADVSGTSRQLFDGAQVTVYDANGTALVSDTINTGASDKLSFLLPSYVTVAKGTPVVLTVKLDQVPNAVSTAGKTLMLTFDKDDVNAKEIINLNQVYPAADATSTTLTSVLGGTPTVVSQSYTNDLVKYGSADTIGSIKIKAVNADIVLKDMLFKLNGLTAASGHMNKISSAKLYEDGVEVATLTKTGIYLQADDVNKTIALGTTKNYEVKATVSAINTNTDVLPTFVTVLDSSSYESTYGSALSTNLTGNVSANITAVNEIPTVTAVSATTKGNNVVYKITLASTKETTLSGVKLSVLGTNLSGGSAALNGLTGKLASDDLGSTVYATATVASNTLTLGGLSNTLVSVIGTRDIYVILENAVILSTTDSPATVRVSLTDMSYNDVFEDDTKYALNGMLAGYQTLMAGTLDLTSIATIN